MYIFRQKSFSTPKIDLISKLNEWKQNNWVNRFPSSWISPLYTPIWIDKGKNLVGVIKIFSDNNNNDNQVNVGVYLGRGGNLLRKVHKGVYKFDDSPFLNLDNLEPYNELEFKRDLLTNLRLRSRYLESLKLLKKVKDELRKNLKEEEKFINNIL